MLQYDTEILNFKDNGITFEQKHHFDPKYSNQNAIIKPPCSEFKTAIKFKICSTFKSKMSLQNGGAISPFCLLRL